MKKVNSLLIVVRCIEQKVNLFMSVVLCLKVWLRHSSSSLCLFVSVRSFTFTIIALQMKVCEASII